MGTIRLLLALAVLLIMHSTPLFGIPMIGGAGAVQGFYVISGFYMALVLNEKYPRGAGGYREFITQRFLRLMPGYWVCLIAMIFLGMSGWGTVLPKSAEHSPYEFWRTHVGILPGYQIVYLAFSQVFLLGQDWLLFMGVTPGRGLIFTANYLTLKNSVTPVDPAYQFLFVGPAWSLGVELTFYLVAPFIVRRRWWIIGVVVATSVCIRLAASKITHTSISADPWVYRFFPSELGTFLLGSLGYHFYAHAKRMRWDLHRLGWIAWITMLIAIFAVPCIPQVIPGRPFIFFSMMTACVPFIFWLTKNWKIDRWIGELSYPIYIVHFVVGAVLAKIHNSRDLESVKGWELLLATIPIAILIRLVVEEPVDRWRQRIYQRKEHRVEPAEVISPAPM
ncbi:MAG TPA: acyltransferase [Tepidisphaeraceae bacterium]|nr:acyltransferase [Tepidisphaeraceae bacterium]